MDNSSLILSLAIVTLAIVLAVAVVSYLRNRQAKRTNQHSAVTEDHPELRSNQPMQQATQRSAQR